MKRYDVQSCRIAAKREIAPGIFDVWVEAPEFAAAAQPGQFAQILVPGKTLRRPISICDAADGMLRFVFQVRGGGTARLAKDSAGDAWDILAPLGHGFSLPARGGRALFVGGGSGVPPLLFAARQLGAGARAVLGFRSRDGVILEEDFARAGCEVAVATEDGSAGYHGLVTGCLDGPDPDAVFACGPTPMLRAVAAWAEEKGVPCQLSLEERMACGLGACLGCACKLRRDGREEYGHVCKDGPVFDAREIVWEVE